MKSFHEFVIIGGKIEPIAYFVFDFVIKKMENLYKKLYPSLQTAVKTFRKHQNILKGIHKNRQIFLNRFLDECTLFLTYFSLFEGAWWW